jgi:hypothetical protein
MFFENLGWQKRESSIDWRHDKNTDRGTRLNMAENKRWTDVIRARKSVRTFDGRDLSPAHRAAMALQADEVMPAASPVGYAAKRSIRERAMRKAVKADTRLPFERLFFASDFAAPLTPETAGNWADPLEMVRLAPSAVNKQPWRVVTDGQRVHFYECRSRGISKGDVLDIQQVDLGIALCHFELAAREAALSGHFAAADPGIACPDHTTYVLTYEADA